MKLFRKRSKSAGVKGSSDKASAEKIDAVLEQFPFKVEKRNTFSLLSKAYGATLLLLIVAMLWMQYNYKQLLSSKEQEVYVVRDDRVYHALKQEKVERDMYEYENHLKLFMHNAFAYNKHNFDERMAIALELIDHESGVAFYNGLAKARTKDRLISLNCSAEIIIDSLEVRQVADKIEGRVLFEQQTHFEDKSISKFYEIKSELRSVNRSPQNGYGVEIFNVNYFNYEPARDLASN